MVYWLNMPNALISGAALLGSSLFAVTVKVALTVSKRFKTKEAQEAAMFISGTTIGTAVIGTLAGLISHFKDQF